MSDDDQSVELSDDTDFSKTDVPTEELLEVEVVDEVPLLADEPDDPLEIGDEDDEYRELELLMDPYGLNDY